MMYATFLTLLCFLAIGQGYILDSSCTKDTKTKDAITENLERAFATARIARDALNRRPWKPEDDGPLMELAKWIFKEDGQAKPIAAHIDPPLSPMEKNSADKRNNLDKLRDVYDGILKMEKRLNGGESGQVVSLSNRFVKSRTVRNRVWDRTRKMFFFFTHKDMFKCSTPLLMAWTSPPPKNYEPYTMQICPDYLTEVMGSKIRSTARFKKLGWTGIPLLVGLNTAMDFASMFDNTLLHELCHTEAAGDLDDTGRDSIAYFALGARIILTQKYKPEKDGNISEMQTSDGRT
ncbi:hypothetical protein AJ80_03399 [Polytolypa hystricis UAMH7299]|uniref:Lysine-specific metallo-endopeptidase domain-containing protein n=1 Tax=Polytolypa hystricis (strain UAMH7299) TaxID=1447883 RepID=A0A2B7YKI6_POLH7|nr:hypothetical protein AJ80_03399 [Polytolypa hystricis UAMH7299]